MELYEEESLPQEQVESNEFRNQVYDKYVKSGGNKKNKQEIIDPETVKLVIDKISEAIRKDKDLMIKKLPSLEKLKLLKYIEQLLVKKAFASEFLRQGGLNYLQEFICKNRDGTYPVFNQIERVLELLDSMPIERVHLEDCNIGRYVNDISDYIQDSINISRKAKKLFNKWTRILNDSDINYTSIENENEAYRQIFTNKKRHRERPGADKMDCKKLYENMNENRKVPSKALFDYTNAPEDKSFTIQKEEILKRKSYFLPAKKEGGKKKSGFMVSEL